MIYFTVTDKEFDILTDIYSDQLYRFLVKNLRSSEDAADIVQDTFMSACENKANILPDKAKSWLFTVAHNKMMSFIRYNKIRGGIARLNGGDNLSEDVDNIISNDGSIKKFEQMQMISHAFESLSDNERTCLQLRDWEGFSYKEIADITSINEQTVKTYIFRGRMKVKKILADS